MLICPECQTENIEQNEICDNCGTSLTHHNCSSCGEQISYSEFNCPHCGAVSVNSYQCIISTDKTPVQIPFTSTNDTIEESSSRYLISKSLLTDELIPCLQADGNQLYSLSVMDGQPLKKSSLDQILEEVEGFDRQSLITAGIPALALPYLTLAEYCPIVPELLDAWQDSDTNQEFVIIPQRVNWQPLASYWQSHNLDSQLILSYLQKIAKLWKSFIKVKCCQTLLELFNIADFSFLNGSDQFID